MYSTISLNPRPHIPLQWIPFAFPHIPQVACAFQMRGAQQAHETKLAPTAHGNISLNIQDDKNSVIANRVGIVPSLNALMGTKNSLTDWAELYQIHGDIMYFEPDAQDPYTASTIEGDGFATSRASRGLMIKTADCQPVLLAHKDGKHIAALHVGWRGNRIDFIASAVDRFCSHYGLLAKDIMAVRGPSLGPSAAQFTNFATEWGDDFATWFSAREQTMNLWQLTRDQLCAAGLMPQHVYGLDLCTLTLDHAFFSYRRERATGRQASFIWIKG